MARLAFLIVTAVLIVFALHKCGGDPEDTAVATADAERDAAKESSGEAAPAVDADSPTAPGGGAEPPPSSLDDAIDRALAGEELGTLEKDLRRAASLDPAGVEAALLRAVSADPTARWLGWTAVYDHLPVDHPRHAAILERVMSTAREGAASASQAVDYVVVGGDSLWKISKKAKAEHGIITNSGLIQWANGMRSDRIQPKQRLRIPRGPLRIDVSKAHYFLRVYLGDGLIREFPVGLGREDRTPSASFTIDSRQEKPPWPDPETGKLLHYGEPGYQIGTRWLGFADVGPYSGFGIHGTDDPSSIGKNMSLGCVRLRNHDVEELFELVPEGATVVIE